MGVRYTPGEQATVDFVRAHLAGKRAPKTIDIYSHMAVKLWKMTHPGQAMQGVSIKWLNQPRHFIRLPELIASTYPNPYTCTSVMGSATALAKVFGFQEAYQYLRILGPVMDEGRQRVSDQEHLPASVERHWATYAELRQRADELVAAMDVLGEAPLEGAMDFRIQQHGLLALMNIMTPNARSAPARMRIVREEPPAAALVHGADNLLWVDDTHAEMYINTDKISHRMGVDSWELPAEVAGRLRASLVRHPRTWLFSVSQDVDEPLPEADYNSQLREAFTMGDRTPGTRIIRHALVDNFYKTNPSPSLREKQRLARRMRHSADIAELLYRKCLVDSNSEGE